MTLQRPPEAVFLDTCILLNYLYRRWEGDKVSALLEQESLDHVVSESVIQEFETVCDRRGDIYPDLLDYLIEEETGVEHFDPYVAGNDRRHLRTILGELAQIEDRREVQARVRHFLRELEARVETVREELLDNIVELNPYIELQFRVADVIDNHDDVKVVCDAAYWCAECEGDGPLVTLDSRDLIDNEADINETLIEEKDEAWRIEITIPKAVQLEPVDATAERTD
jgi:hypothetical protein